MSNIFRYTLLIMAIAVSFLFSPQPKSQKDYCGQYIHLGKHAGFTFNCDAPDYCMNARYPSRVLDEHAVRQSRPLFILLASAIGYPAQWLTDALNLSVFHSMGEEANMYVGFYIGYIIINFLALLVSLLLFESIAMYITKGNINKWILLAFQVVLVSNEITKAFFWTAHQQFFSFLTPLLTIWLALLINEQKRTQKNIGMWALLCGVGMLLYGNFLTTFGTIVIVAFLTDKKIHPVHLLKNAVLFLLPTIIWISYCKYHHGHYYNHEVEVYRQLVWVSDTLKVSTGHFLATLGKNIQAYFSRYGEMWLFIAMAVVSGIYAAKQASGNNLRNIVITASVLVAFFMILGFYEERLTYTLLPVCLCLTLLALHAKGYLQKNIAVYLFAALAWHVYTLLSYGPFS